MDAQAAESSFTERKSGWLARERESGRLYRILTVSMSIWLVAVVAISVALLVGTNRPGGFLSTPMIAMLVVAILIPAIVLMVLFSRTLVMKRARQRGLEGGRLHTRLLALFSAIAAVPTVLTVLFAALTLQSGLEFWFSDRPRDMLENAVKLAQTTYEMEEYRVYTNTLMVAKEMDERLPRLLNDGEAFSNELFGQAYYRNLSEIIVFRVGDDGVIRTLGLVNPADRPIEQVVTKERLEQLRTKPSRHEGRAFIQVNSADRIGALSPLNLEPNLYVYASRVFDPEFAKQIDRALDVQTTYGHLQDRARLYQLRFNGALLIGALLIVGLAVFFALKIADRLIRPVGELVNAVGRVEEGDFSARVPVHQPHDEIAILGSAFNRMTGRLQEQTGALVQANEQLDTRRAFIEAVLSSVTAGVVALDDDGRILLLNRSAETLLEPEGEEIEGKELSGVSAELAEFVAGEARDANVVIASDSGERTLAVKRVRYADGAVLTFDDITDQLSDQRRAAWSDIARRIAHEIKNPLTPIQLAAERLQRRYGKEVTSDRDTFDRLTSTIVRQVGDLRRMVDEFSNFARMPKPVFREENVHEIARAALFLHEVAHPGVAFSIDPASANIPMVCDRRQLGQALTNVVKNAVEAIEARRNRNETNFEGDRIDVKVTEEGRDLVIDVFDTGVGLPENRERLTEPYMTTRVRGTGLGLAIVKKIVEEHMGEIAFLDRASGGTHVRVMFDRERLAELASDEVEGGDSGPRMGDDGEYDEEVGK